MGKLTLKQRKFADEYIITGNATDAALKAGYSKKTAYSIGNENLKKPEIKRYIDARLEEIQSQKVANQREILEFLTSIVRGEQTEETLRGVGEGAQTIDDIDVSAKDRIKAAELLGKRYAMWTDKQQVDMVIPVFVEDVPDDD
ncbi:terminase small subunit [Niallia sp. FSL K6-0212]|uniref:terminase small subunit n=1 Tax=Niallia sp. FSL K6-0212 TaxID=2921423 RepID=UPI0030FBC0AA